MEWWVSSSCPDTTLKLIPSFPGACGISCDLTSCALVGEQKKETKRCIMECHIITGVMKNLSQDSDGQGHFFFFNSGWGQRRWLNLRREVKERCSRQSYDKGHITRAPWDTNPEKSPRAMPHLAGYSRDLDFCSQHDEESLENWGQQSGTVYVFKSSFFIYL